MRFREFPESCLILVLPDSPSIVPGVRGQSPRLRGPRRSRSTRQVAPGSTISAPTETGVSPPHSASRIRPGRDNRSRSGVVCGCTTPRSTRRSPSAPRPAPQSAFDPAARTRAWQRSSPPSRCRRHRPRCPSTAGPRAARSDGRRRTTCTGSPDPSDGSRVSGLRCRIAISSAASTSSVRRCVSIAQPTTLRLKTSSTMAR